jgi:hypothetical protein
MPTLYVIRPTPNETSNMPEQQRQENLKQFEEKEQKQKPPRHRPKF